MKRFLLLFVTVFFATAVCVAQNKVVEKSGKQPKWVNGLEKDYIIVVASGEDIQTAQQNALTMVKEQIVLSVAENVKSTTEVKRQESTNNDISNFLETFASTTTSQSGKVPFLQGISISKVEEFYWEKIRKSDKSIFYSYHLKYPFPNIELHKLVGEYKKRDNELTAQMQGLLDNVDNVNSVEEIEKNIAELKTLKEYFMDGRIDQCNLGITRYQELLKSIELVELESRVGELKYYLRLGDKAITTSKKPQTKSECARILSTVNSKDAVTVKYDYENCYEDPENNIIVKYRIAGKEISKSFYFDVAENSVSIFMSDPIHFITVEKDGETVSKCNVDLSINSKYESEFTIEKVVLEWSGEAPIIIEGLDSRFKGKGNHMLKLEINQPINIKNTTSLGKRVTLMSGYIHYKSNATGVVKTYRIYNHNYTTNW